MVSREDCRNTTVRSRAWCVHTSEADVELTGKGNDTYRFDMGGLAVGVSRSFGRMTSVLMARRMYSDHKSRSSSVIHSSIG